MLFCDILACYRLRGVLREEGTQQEEQVDGLDGLIKEERLTTFNSELGGGAVLAVLVGGGAAVHALVRHANAPDDQGQQPAHLRAPHPLCVCQTLAVMIPLHPAEGLPGERAAELGHLAAVHLDVTHFHQQFRAG